VQAALRVVSGATGQRPKTPKMPAKKRNPAAVVLGGKKVGKARAEALTPEQRVTEQSNAATTEHLKSGQTQA